MKKYFCDVCGVELPDGWDARPGDSQVMALCRLEDLCVDCAKLTGTLDVSGLVLAEVRRQRERLSAAGEKAVQPSQAPPVLAGRGAKEKQAVLSALKAFRQERGPGAISILADLSGVDEDKIRDMVICQKVPLADWRAVGKALGVPEGRDRPDGEGEA